MARDAREGYLVNQPPPPRRKLPSEPTGYHLQIREEGPRVEAEQTPMSIPPKGVELRGNGWKLNVPTAVLIAAVSAIGARYLPTQTSTDVKIDRQASEQQDRDRRDAERWEDVRARLVGIEQRLGRLEDARQNDRVSLEERLKRLEAKP